MSDALSIIITGGGTGGHLFPGIAVAEKFQEHGGGGARVVFVGTFRGLESTVIPREGFPLEFVRSEGFIGKGPYKKIRSVFRMVMSFKDAYNIIRKHRPDIIIGSGGYASFATVFAGIFLLIPTLILEQNYAPGFANRILGKFAKAVCVTYQESISFFPRSKTYLTGNPVRERILRGSRKSAYKIFGLGPGKFTILIFGGSLGASSINKAVVESLQYLLNFKSDMQFLHQTGERDYSFVRDAYRSFGFSGMVTPFIHQMAEAYAVADIVISRAGATTLAELTAVGKPAVLIPYPHAAADHQESNAKKMERMQAALFVRDRDINGRRLADMIRRLYKDQELRDKMQRNCRILGQPQAAKKIFNIAMSIIRKDGAGRV